MGSPDIADITFVIIGPKYNCHCCVAFFCLTLRTLEWCHIPINKSYDCYYYFWIRAQGVGWSVTVGFYQQTGAYQVEEENIGSQMHVPKYLINILEVLLLVKSNGIFNYDIPFVHVISEKKRKEKKKGHNDHGQSVK